MYQTFSMQLETNIRHLVNIWSQYLQCLVSHSAVSTQRGEWVAEKKLLMHNVITETRRCSQYFVNVFITYIHAHTHTLSQSAHTQGQRKAQV